MGVMLWLSGPQGSGKGWFVRLLKPLLGKTWMMVSSLDRLLSKFNSHLVGKLLVVVDEANFNGSHQQADLLKNVITEAEMVVEGQCSATLATLEQGRVNCA
jgi:phage/plasmid-associated DNA primase